MLSRVLAVLFVAVSPAACASPTEVEFERILTLEVAASKATCQQWFGPAPCIQVRGDASAAWAPLHEGIEGFTHEDGFGYELQVVEFRRRNPPADGSSREFRLVRIVRRTAGEVS